MSFLKKIKLSLEIRLRVFTFLPKMMVFSKKKKRFLRKASPRFYTFCPKMLFKKRSLHQITSSFFNFVPKQRCSSLHSEIKIIAQKFVGHAKHDLHALTVRHW